MPDINWNGDAESAPFTSRLDDASGNLILAETDTGTALFEWDGSAWQFRGPVEMNGEDVSGIGSLTATSGNFDSVNTDEATIGDVDSFFGSEGDLIPLFTTSFGRVDITFDNTEFERVTGANDAPQPNLDFVDLTNVDITHVSWSIRRFDADDDSEARLELSQASEKVATITAEDSFEDNAAREVVSGVSGRQTIFIEAKSGDGTDATISGVPEITFWGTLQ